MGGGSVIPTFGVLQMARSCARARKNKFPGKAKIMRTGVTKLARDAADPAVPSTRFYSQFTASLIVRSIDHVIQRCFIEFNCRSAGTEGATHPGET